MCIEYFRPLATPNSTRSSMALSAHHSPETSQPLQAALQGPIDIRKHHPISLRPNARLCREFHIIIHLQMEMLSSLTLFFKPSGIAHCAILSSARSNNDPD